MHAVLFCINQCARILCLRRRTLGRVPSRNENNLEGPGASASRDLKGAHDLTDLSVRLHITVGFDDFSETKGLIDHGLESTGSKMVEDVLFCLREYWIGCQLKEGIGTDGETFVQCREEWVGSGFRRQGSIFKDD